jgi:hypothetical protein
MNGKLKNIPSQLDPYFLKEFKAAKFNAPYFSFMFQLTSTRHPLPCRDISFVRYHLGRNSPHTDGIQFKLQGAVQKLEIVRTSACFKTQIQG